MADATLREHQHGKSRVRLGRTWREQEGGNSKSNASTVRHHFVEWTVETVLESDMAHAFLSSSNAGMTATETQKNAVRGLVKRRGNEREAEREREREGVGRTERERGRGRGRATSSSPKGQLPHLVVLSFVHSFQVYFVAKQLPAPTPPEEFALALARFFVEKYPLVSVAKIRVESAGWSRVAVGGREHAHGFQSDEGGGSGTGRRFAEVVVSRGGGGGGTGGRGATSSGSKTSVVAGVAGWRVLKTTMSGYEGFLRDRFTRLPETRDRIAATSVTASWRYDGPCDYDESYRSALAALGAAFFGPASGGSYSPSLQFTLFEMGKGLLAAVPSAESVHLRLPNLHFLPCAPVNSTVSFFFLRLPPPPPFFSR